MVRAPLLARLALTGTAALALVCAGATPLAAGGLPDPEPRSHGAGPLVIAHRGASGYRPEHTLASYELAARLGADYVEPDLVSTKDGVLVARHDNEITDSTDVANHPEFAARRTTKVIDGWESTGWFTEDFSLAELKTLRAKEPMPDLRQRTTIYDGRYQIPTFQEIIELTRRLSRTLGRDIGIYPETKHPTYFASIGLPLEPPLVRTLTANGLNREGAKVFVQSFEVGNLKRLDKQLRVPLIQLVWTEGQPYDFAVSGDPRGYPDLVTPHGLKEIAAYADGIGPDKSMVIGWNGDGLGAPTALVRDAHRAGLLVHAYTFRVENSFLPANYRSSANPGDYGRGIDEFAAYYAQGVDGVFTDNPDIGLSARDGT
jgi:glycerophosphoryl diester phosphodiesterase